MKRIIFIIVSISIIMTLYVLRTDILSTANNLDVTPTPSSQPTPTQLPTITLGDNNTIAYAYTVIPETQTVLLIPNFSDSKNSTEVFESNKCTSLINGGFYDTNNKPLGLFRISDMVYRTQSSSLLINGYLSRSDTGYTISTTPPQQTRWVFQTGPIVFSEGKKRKLTIRNDETARRSVAAIDSNGLVIFISLFDTQSRINGPLLADVPTLIEQLSERDNLNIVSAINLDGGSASAFISSSVHISEFSNVGSYLCAINK